MNHPALKAMSKLAAGHNYDVMDYHAGKFKVPDEEFQPRIVNYKKSKSKLLSDNTYSSYYQPPLRRKKKKTETKDQMKSLAEDKNQNKENMENNESIEVKEIDDAENVQKAYEKLKNQSVIYESR